MTILNYLDLEAIEYEIGEKSKAKGKTIKEIIGKNNFVISHILRNGKIQKPKEKTTLKKGDKVLLITSIDKLSYLSEMFKVG